MKQAIPKIVAFFATITAFFGSCCVLPLLLMGLTGSIGFASVLIPYQGFFTAATIVLLAFAFFLVYGRKTATCENGKVCNPKSQRLTKILLWISSGLALIFLLGPQLIACLGNT